MLQTPIEEKYLFSFNAAERAELFRQQKGRASQNAPHTLLEVKYILNQAALNDSNLKAIDFHNVSINDDMLKQIAYALVDNTHCQTLSLKDTNLQYQNLSFFVKKMEFSHIAYVDLSQNPLTDVQANALANDNHGKCVYNLCDTAVSPEFIKKHRHNPTILVEAPKRVAQHKGKAKESVFQKIRELFR